MSKSLIGLAPEEKATEDYNLQLKALVENGVEGRLLNVGLSFWTFKKSSRKKFDDDERIAQACPDKKTRVRPAGYKTKWLINGAPISSYDTGGSA